MGGPRFGLSRVSGSEYWPEFTAQGSFSAATKMTANDGACFPCRLLCPSNGSAGEYRQCSETLCDLRFSGFMDEAVCRRHARPYRALVLSVNAATGWKCSI